MRLIRSVGLLHLSVLLLACSGGGEQPTGTSSDNPDELMSGDGDSGGDGDTGDGDTGDGDAGDGDAGDGDAGDGDAGDGDAGDGDGDGPPLTCDDLDCGNGQCVVNSGVASCSCDFGWTGDDCSQAVGGCEDEPCANGRCVDRAGGSYACECDAGYTGANCDVNIDDCAVNPCENGECHDAVNGFSCTCDSGWEGQTCDENRDECASDPCVNGVCTDDIADFSCSCEFGWAGRTCENPVSSCQDNPCVHGDCSDNGPGDYSCLCDAGWAGENCSTCTTDFTLEGGNCIQQKQVDCRDDAPVNATSIIRQVIISYTTAGGWSDAEACEFECIAGWEGASCADSVDDCAGHDCQNGASCVDGHQGFTCDCPIGYSGTRCETEVNDCSTDPCLNGTCEDEADSYVCSCQEGWSGANCGTCATDYVLEGGQCIGSKQVSCADEAPVNATSVPASVTITYTTADGWSDPAPCAFECNSGWQGSDCSQSVNDCTGHSCANGATCVDAHNSYTCDCADGYSGPLCETNIDDCVGDPCNGSSCIDGVNDYTCSCNEGYTGTTCNTCANDYIDEGAGCINSKGATCIDNSPTNASPILESVTITYSSAEGWSTPADCAYSCDPGWTGPTCSTGSGDPGLVDKFDTCDDFIETLDGREGEWFDYHGTGIGGWDADRSSVWDLDCAAWIVGGLVSPVQAWAGMGFSLNEGASGPLYDASGYDNVEVTYASDQEVIFYAKWDFTGSAGNATRSFVTLPATVGLQTVSVPLSSFTGISTTTMTEFQFEPTDIPSGFGIAVTEVRFTGGLAPECEGTETRCAGDGSLEVCLNGEWTASSCSTGESCIGDACVDDDATPVEIYGHLSVVNDRLVGENGALVQLKGISTHWLNYADDDDYETNLDALIWMRDNWGLSLIRAAMGVEESGGYLTSTANRQNMLDDIDDIVNNAVSAGVYVVIDWHTHVTQTSAAQDFFEDMVEAYGHLPNVLYETYNEPLNVSWNTVLRPYHEAVLSRIRTRESALGITHPGVVLMGTPNWDQDVGDVVGNEVSGTNLMYVLHFYACSHGTLYREEGRQALAAGVPLFVTEWGATHADGGVGGTPLCTAEADLWHSWMDENQISSAAWKFDDCDWEIATRGVADSSCLLEQDAPSNGGWGNSQLTSHGEYVRSKIQN